MLNFTKDCSAPGDRAGRQSSAPDLAEETGNRAVTIDGGGGGDVINSAQGSLTLRNLTLTNGVDGLDAAGDSVLLFQVNASDNGDDGIDIANSGIVTQFGVFNERHDLSCFDSSVVERHRRQMPSAAFREAVSDVDDRPQNGLTTEWNPPHESIAPTDGESQVTRRERSEL